MAPTSAYMIQNEYEEPISRTYQYRKVMKPMLERKRRARINRCLDELKELMVTALQAEGENVSKLEKADILELTVRHLHQLKRQSQFNLSTSPEQSYADRFRAGFTHCAAEVSHFLTTANNKDQLQQNCCSIDPNASAKLLQHLNTCIRHLENSQQLVQNSKQQSMMSQQYYKQQYTPPTSPVLQESIYNQQKINRVQSNQQFVIQVNKQTTASNQQLIHSSTNNSTLMWRPW